MSLQPGESESGKLTLVASEAARVLIVIVNYKTADLTVACLESLAKDPSPPDSFRVVVVENNSGDGEYLSRAIEDRQWGNWVELDIADRNGGFSYGNNRGIEPALRSKNPPKYIILLNADTEVRPGAIRILVEFMDGHPKVGLAGSSFENPDGSDWPIAFRFITPISEFERGICFGPVTKLLRRFVVPRVMEQDRPQPVDWVAGACMIIRREVFDRIGLMDEGYFLYFEEVDFCLRARRAGWPCWYVPESRVMHIAGQSSGLTKRDARPPRTPAFWFASRQRYFRRNFGVFGALVADLGFATGFALWRFRRFITRRPDTDPPHHLRDFIKHSFKR